MRALCVMLVVACGGGAAKPAPVAPPDELTRTITGLDRAFFDAFNGCDLEKLASYLAEDLEFYHEAAGLASGRQSMVDAVRKNICDKTRRELVTVKAYRLGDYGALEVGTHRFCEPKGAKCEVIAEFMHVWKREGERWIVTRIASYDHRPLP